MSDIQAQARRDAEFDRLLAELMNEKYVDYTAWDMRQAYEMGKRHQREELANVVGVIALPADEVNP